MHIDTPIKRKHTPAPFVRKTLLSLALSPLLLAQATLPVMASGSNDNRYLDSTWT